MCFLILVALVVNRSVVNVITETGTVILVIIERVIMQYGRNKDSVVNYFIYGVMSLINVVMCLRTSVISDMINNTVSLKDSSRVVSVVNWGGITLYIVL